MDRERVAEVAAGPAATQQEYPTQMTHEMRDDAIDCTAAERSPIRLAVLRAALVEQERPLRLMAQHYALLGGETRLKILTLLRGVDELCVCDLASVLEMTPAAVSQHLSRLRAGRLVDSRRDGMTIYYRLSRTAAESIVGPRIELPGDGEAADENVG